MTGLPRTLAERTRGLHPAEIWGSPVNHCREHMCELCPDEFISQLDLMFSCCVYLLWLLSVPTAKQTPKPNFRDKNVPPQTLCEKGVKPTSMKPTKSDTRCLPQKDLRQTPSPTLKPTHTHTHALSCTWLLVLSCGRSVRRQSC